MQKYTARGPAGRVVELGRRSPRPPWLPVPREPTSSSSTTRALPGAPRALQLRSTGAQGQGRLGSALGDQGRVAHCPAARAPSRWTCSATACGPLASTTRSTSTTTSPPASATTGRASTAACEPCGRTTCSSSGSSTGWAGTSPPPANNPLIAPGLVLRPAASGASATAAVQRAGRGFGLGRALRPLRGPPAVGWMGRVMDEDQIIHRVRRTILALGAVAFVYGSVTGDDDVAAYGGVVAGAVLLLEGWESAEEWLRGGGIYRVVRSAGEVWRRLRREWRG